MSRDAVFEREGFKFFPQAAAGTMLGRLREMASHFGGVGTRLDQATLGPIADLIGQNGPIGQIASTLCERPPFVVRAILFDKPSMTNWSLDWHQDRTINVAEKIECVGFGPWTVKQGLLHVQPPQSVIEEMITLRVHLDEVPASNAPLRVIPGSHRIGRMAESGIALLAARSCERLCLASSGDVWAYRSAIVHASSVVDGDHQGRRVLQFDYACRALEPPLRWAMMI